MSEENNEQIPAEVEIKTSDGDVVTLRAKTKGPKGKHKFLLLCGHPPHTDPRILYMADSLARMGEVTIVPSSDYGKKDESALVYKRYSTRSFRSAKNRSVFAVLRDYWPWFNPKNFSLVFKIIGFGWKRRFGLPMGHLRDLTLGFLPFYARNLTHKTFDCIVCCDAYMMECAIVAKQLQSGSQLIFDAHEVFYSEINQPVERDNELRKVEERWLRHVDRMFVVSRGIQALYLKRNPHLKGRVHCLPNAIPFCGVKKERITANASGKVKFLFQGGYHKTRGIDRLLEIWAALPECNASLTLRMVGYTHEELATLKAIYACDSVRNEVILDEPVKEDELVDACVGFDVGIIPYPAEVSLGNFYCCPNKLGQYLNAGCAVLVTDSRYLRRLVKDMECGWSYDPNNIQASAALIREIVADRQALFQKRQRGLHHAEHDYNWDIMDRIVESVIKK